MAVLPFAEADIPQVADLYWTYMRHLQGSAARSVWSTFRELYFTNPFVETTFPPLVYEGQSGEIVGFLGITVRKMSAGGEPIRVAYGGNFVVHPKARSSLAARRLLAALIGGTQDLTLTDSANDLSRKIVERIGFRNIPALNFHWARPLRPSQCAVYALSRSTGRRVSAGLRLAAKPFCVVADNMAARLSGGLFRQTKSHLRGTELDVETLLHCLVEFRKGYSLWPEYDGLSLKWLLNFMEQIPTRGELRKIVVRDHSQKIMGWYIYYMKSAGVGEVVQIGCDVKHTKVILDHLFYDAWEHGVIALLGVVDSRRMADFSDKNCYFTCRGGWALAYSRNPELVKVLERGDAFLSRLDGEWCLDPGE